MASPGPPARAGNYEKCSDSLLLYYTRWRNPTNSICKKDFFSLSPKIVLEFRMIYFGDKSFEARFYIQYLFDSATKLMNWVFDLQCFENRMEKMCFFFTTGRQMVIVDYVHQQCQRYSHTLFTRYGYRQTHKA